MMDVSDGLVQDCGHIASASSLAAEIVAGDIDGVLNEPVTLISDVA